MPFMGISKPGAYFFDHGWEVAAVNGGCSVLRHTVDSVHAESGSTSLNSVNDVLHNSYAKGYVDEILTEPANHVALMMAISVKPIFAPLATNVSANDVVEEDSAAEGVQDPMSISIATCKWLAIADLPTYANHLRQLWTPTKLQWKAHRFRCKTQ